MPQTPRRLVWPFVILLAWLAAYEVHIVLAPRFGVHGVFEKHVHLAVLVAAALLTLLRALARREERLGWALIGAGVMAWALGEVYYTVALWDLPSIPIPSWADAGYLAFPLLTFAGIIRLARERFRTATVTLWADGLAASLSVGAASAAMVLDPVLRHTAGHSLEVVTNLAYPVTDLVLIGACVTLMALRGWRLDRTWLLIGIGVLVFWIADSLYLVQTALGTYTPGGVFDEGWWLGLVLIAMAAWQPCGGRVPERDAPQQSWMIALPVGFASVAALVLAYGSLRVAPLNVGAVGLALGALAAVAVRLIITFRASLTLLGAVRAEALTDAVTGLANRRALTRALAERTRAALAGGPPVVLALYDLDGFKRYNDSFGHPAGDTLLARLGSALTATVAGRGSGYRMGGDEFCVLCDGELDELLPLLEAAAQALSANGDGFSVSSSWGVVRIPAEADSAEAALRVADQRMYAHKQDGRPSASRQSTDVLLRALAERHPHLDEHALDVAELAERTAAALGLEGADAEEVRLAAELHDIGKVAIPDTILEKPGPLDEREWEYVRRHPVVGERIISAAPSLHRIAQMVRASHERFDGGGYPDGTVGSGAPLGARIISVCDAYDAMIAARPYSGPLDPEQALAELRRCAGSQFDPDVVEAFCAVLEVPEPGLETAAAAA